MVPPSGETIGKKESYLIEFLNILLSTHLAGGKNSRLGAKRVA